MTFVMRLFMLALGFIGLACQAQAPDARLEQGIRANDAAEVNAALQAGADANMKTSAGTPALTLATHFSGMRVVRSLLDHGARVAAVDHHGGTALHAASSWGRTDLMEQYLERGANPNAADNAGATPMHAAVHGAQPEAVALLAKRGADINVQPRRLHSTPLMTAFRLNIGNDRLPTILALLGAGADPNLVDARGDSALHLSVRGNPATFSPPAIKALLDSKASATLANRKGETPLQLAAKSGRPDIEGLFSSKPSANAPAIVASPVTASLVPGERKRYKVRLRYGAKQGGLLMRIKLTGNGADKLSLDTDGLVAATLPGCYWVRVPQREHELPFYVVARQDADPRKAPVAISTTIVDADGEPTHATHVQMLVEIKSPDRMPGAPARQRP